MPDVVRHRGCCNPAGQVLAIIGTTGNREISINRGSAAERLFVSTSEQVCVELA
jgi:S-adenosylmethionine hydrolase